MSVDSGELLEVLAARDRFEARVVAEIDEFDRHELWDEDAATSMTAWLRDRARMSPRAAARLVMLARSTRALPVTRAAWASGSVSGGQLDVVLGFVRKDADLFASHEAELIPQLASLDIAGTITAMSKWRQLADALAEAPEPQEPPSRVFLSKTLDGRGALDGDLESEDAEIVRTALRVAERDALEGEPPRTPAERRADALTDVCQFFLDNQKAQRGGRHRPHLNIILDLESGACRFADGSLLPTSTAERYLCDCNVHRILTDGRSTIIDFGTATRVITAALSMALAIRDGHCRFPGCDRPAHWCDGHHIKWFSQGGPTRLDNLVLLCRRHHKRLHQPGWHAKLLPDGTFEVTNPDGLTRSSRPPGTLEPFP